MVRRGVGQLSSCEAPPTYAGYGGRPPIRVFPCDQHAGQMEDAAPMTDEDRAELEGRIVQSDRAMAGLPHERVGPVGFRKSA